MFSLHISITLYLHLIKWGIFPSIFVTQNHTHTELSKNILNSSFSPFSSTSFVLFSIYFLGFGVWFCSFVCLNFQQYGEEHIPRFLEAA